MSVRFFVALIAALCAPAAALADGFAGLADDAAGFTVVMPGKPLAFPRDFGAHPGFRTEWWYVTGWLEDDAGHELGFQITFFRTRPDLDPANPSAFAARQILIAHAALLSPPVNGLASWHAEAVAGGYRARAVDEEGAGLTLHLTPTQPPLLNGSDGYSRKGPQPGAASYYISVPQLTVDGEVAVRDRDGARPARRAVHGRAWLDHEWSSAYLDPSASGWDWVGLNGADGSALMAFRIRDLAGAARFAGATRRAADGTVEHFGPEAVRFVPGRQWRSPHTGTAYPVEWSVEVGPRRYRLRPLLDDQEADTRRTTGAVYWEGAVRSRAEGDADGRGFLELTGYGTRLTLPGSAP